MLPKIKSLGTYQITTANMQAKDIPHLHALSIAIRWPHRAEDWAELLQLGEGIVARDTLSRLICSMMWFPMGTQFASIGMGISSPRLQELGAGRWMGEYILKKLSSKNVLLHASKDSLHLCLGLDFKIIQPVFHYHGIAANTPNLSTRTAHIQESDYETIARLDEAAMGINRGQIIKYLLSVSEAVVIRQQGEIKGFALCRKFGRGQRIGPIVAETEEDAVTLIHPFVQHHKNQHLHIDTYQSGGPLDNYLTNIGLRCHKTGTRMALGELPSPFGVAQTMALANQAIG